MNQLPISNKLESYNDINELTDRSKRISISRLPITKQIIVITLIWLQLKSSTFGIKIHQRTLASLLDIHYNSINRHLQTLLDSSVIEKIEQKNKLYSFYINTFPNYVLYSLVMNEPFKSYLSQWNITRHFHQQELQDEHQPEEIPDERIRKIEKLNHYLSKNKSDLAKKLAKTLISELNDFTKNTQVLLGPNDYYQKIRKYLDDFRTNLSVDFITHNPTKKPQQSDEEKDTLDVRV